MNFAQLNERVFHFANLSVEECLYEGINCLIAKCLNVSARFTWKTYSFEFPSKEIVRILSMTQKQHTPKAA